MGFNQLLRFSKGDIRNVMFEFLSNSKQFIDDGLNFEVSGFIVWSTDQAQLAAVVNNTATISFFK